MIRTVCCSNPGSIPFFCTNLGRVTKMKETIQKAVSVFIVSALALTLTACGNNSTQEDESSDVSTEISASEKRSALCIPLTAPATRFLRQRTSLLYTKYYIALFLICKAFLPMHFFRFRTKAFRTGKMIQRKRACIFRFFMYTIHSVHCTALKMTMLAEGSRQLLPFSVSACTYGDRKIPQASGSTRSDIQKTG